MDSKKEYPYRNVDEYIALQPVHARPLLETLRATIQEAAPDAEEALSYGMPVYKQAGVLVYFGAFKNHYSLFALPKTNVLFKDQLSRFKVSKGTIQFSFDQPVPVELVKRIVEQRVIENTAKKKEKDLAKKKK